MQNPIHQACATYDPCFYYAASCLGKLKLLTKYYHANCIMYSTPGTMILT